MVMDYYELVSEHLAWETYHLSEWPFWLCIYGSSMICELLEDMNGVQKERCAKFNFSRVKEQGSVSAVWHIHSCILLVVENSMYS